MSDLPELPDFRIPDSAPRLVGPAEYERWMVDNLVELARAGLLRELLDRPERVPVRERFVLDSADEHCPVGSTGRH